MEIEIMPDAQAVARQAAIRVAGAARAAVAERGHFTFAVSGGTTPWQMLRVLSTEDVPWSKVHVFQVDERVAPAGDAQRNLTNLRESLLRLAPLPEDQVHAMAVEEADLAAAANRYAGLVAAIAGAAPALDLVHLGLGTDGHTASLVPHDPVLDVTDADVSVTGGEYQGHYRMTMTYPLLDRARQILWLVTGASKSQMLQRLRSGDEAIPAGRVRAERALLIADRHALGELAD